MLSVAFYFLLQTNDLELTHTHMAGRYPVRATRGKAPERYTDDVVPLDDSTDDDISIPTEEFDSSIESDVEEDYKKAPEEIRALVAEGKNLDEYESDGLDPDEESDHVDSDASYKESMAEEEDSADELEFVEEVSDEDEPIDEDDEDDEVILDEMEEDDESSLDKVDMVTEWSDDD